MTEVILRFREVVNAAYPGRADELMRTIRKSTDPAVLAKIVRSVDAKICSPELEVRLLTNPRFDLRPRMPYDRSLRIHPWAPPWGTPFTFGERTHEMVMLNEMMSPARTQSTYDLMWNLACSDSEYRHDISRFMYDFLMIFYRDSRVAAEYDPATQQMKCFMGPGVPAEYKTPKAAAIDIIRVVINALFGILDTYWAHEHTRRRPKNLVDPSMDWRMVSNKPGEWETLAEVHRDMHEFFDADVGRGYTLRQMVTRNVPRDDYKYILGHPTSPELMKNVVECHSVVKRFIIGQSVMLWHF